MDAPVRYQLCHRPFGYFAADRVKAADRDRFGRVIHDDIDAG